MFIPAHQQLASNFSASSTINAAKPATSDPARDITSPSQKNIVPRIAPAAIAHTNCQSSSETGQFNHCSRSARTLTNQTQTYCLVQAFTSQTGLGGNTSQFIFTRSGVLPSISSTLQLFCLSPSSHLDISFPHSHTIPHCGTSEFYVQQICSITYPNISPSSTSLIFPFTLRHPGTWYLTWYKSSIIIPHRPGKFLFSSRRPHCTSNTWQCSAQRWLRFYCLITELVNYWRVSFVSGNRLNRRATGFSHRGDPWPSPDISR